MRNTGSDPVEALSARVLKDALFRYFYKNKLPSTKQFPLDSLFATERRTSSVLHGLATSLGTGLWQKLAEQIAGNFGGFSVVKPPLLEQPVDLQEADKIIQPWLAKRNAKGASIELTDYIAELKRAFPNPSASTQKFQPLEKSLGVDLLLSKGGAEWAIESKTVQINASGGRGFNEKLMRWYAYRCLQRGATHKFTAYLAIPYNPYSEDWFSAQAGRIHPLTKRDVLVEGAYWDFLCGKKGTWPKIQRGFDQVAQSESLISLYRETFQKNAPTDFRLRLLGLHIGCELMLSTSQSGTSRWRCYKCDSEFQARASQLDASPETGHPKFTECPSCKRPLLDNS